jgi:hypothetical protein
MTKLISALHNFANSPESDITYFITDSTFIYNKYAFQHNNVPKFAVFTYLNLISAIHAAFPVKI